jgi:hypothetical protein
MNRALWLLGLTSVLLGCDPDEVVGDINDFFATPCRDECLNNPGFQNCSWCRCQQHQFSMFEHVCCQGDQCKKLPEQMDPKCGLPEDGKVHVAVNGLTSTPSLPKCAEPFNVVWSYFNLSSGTLNPPPAHGLALTQLQVLEVAVASSPPPFEDFRNVPWATIEPCQHEPRMEAFSDGLIPKFASVGTYSLNIFNVPADTPGATGSSIRVDSTNSECVAP